MAESTLILEVEKILIYYDLPQLFIARDQVDSKYVCLLVDSDSDFAEYISIPVSTKRLNELILGKTDLRNALLNSELGIWYQVTFNEDGEFVTTAMNFDVVDEKFLPDADFFFPEIEPANEVIVAESVSKNNAIVHLSFVDEQNRNSMSIELLGDFMKLFQNFIKYTYKKAMTTMKMPQLDAERNYTLRAFAASPGSFNVHLESLAVTDLFGNSAIEYALSRIDEIIGDISDEKDLLEKAKLSKGHAIGAYKKILENIIKNKVDISYKWVSAASKEVHLKRINREYAEKAIDILSSTEELGTEIKEFVGYVREIDIDNSKWRIYNVEDKKSYSGKADNVDLGGIIIDTTLYKFVCEEVIEMTKVDDKEKSTYHLVSYGPA